MAYAKPLTHLFPVSDSRLGSVIAAMLPNIPPRVDVYFLKFNFMHKKLKLQR